MGSQAVVEGARGKVAGELGDRADHEIQRSRRRPGYRMAESARSAWREAGQHNPVSRGDGRGRWRDRDLAGPPPDVVAAAPPALA